MKTLPHAVWNQVKKQVTQTKPPCHEATPCMFTFLKNFCHEGVMEGIDKTIKGSLVFHLVQTFQNQEILELMKRIFNC